MNDFMSSADADNPSSLVFLHISAAFVTAADDSIPLGQHCLGSIGTALGRLKVGHVVQTIMTEGFLSKNPLPGLILFSSPQLYVKKTSKLALWLVYQQSISVTLFLTSQSQKTTK